MGYGVRSPAGVIGCNSLCLVFFSSKLLSWFFFVFFVFLFLFFLVFSCFFCFDKPGARIGEGRWGIPSGIGRRGPPRSCEKVSSHGHALRSR